MTEPPRMRAGNSDRQAAVDRLSAHFADGRLDAAEFDQRVATAYGSTYLDELQPLFVDLPEGRPERPAWDRGPQFGPRSIPGAGGYGRRPGGPPPPIRLALFALFVMVMIWSVAAVSHGFFPFPLIWLVIAMMLIGRLRHRRHHYHGRR